MTVSPFLPAPERVQAALVAHGVLSGTDNEWVRILPASWPRRSSARRRQFQILLGEECRTHLYVGLGLAAGYERAKSFHQECPEVTAEPQFFFEHEGYEFYGRRFIVGETLEDAFQRGRLPEADVEQLVACLQQRLAGTEQSSSHRRWQEELYRLAVQLDEIEHFNALDRELLRSAILPELKSRLQSLPARTRWSNGDFIARNMILTPEKELRLIDDEFAERTHFFAEDWIRFSRYSQLSPALGAWARESLGDQRETIELYSLLRQVVLESTLKTPAELKVTLDWAVREMLRLLDGAQSPFRTSVFLRHAQGDPTEAATPLAVQLFYASGEPFAETRASARPLAEHQWQYLEWTLNLNAGAWHLRLDPTDRPGLIEISALDVTCSRTGACLFTLRDADQRTRVVADGTAALLRGPENIRLLSYGDDPQLLLPPVTVAADLVRVGIWMQVQPLLTGLARIAPDLVAGAPPVEAPDLSRERDLIAERDRMFQLWEEQQRIMTDRERQQESIRAAFDQELQHQREQLAHSRDREADTQQELLAVRQVSAHALAERDAARHQVQAAEARLRELTEDSHELKSHCQDLQSMLVLVREELQTIQQHATTEREDFLSRVAANDQLILSLRNERESFLRDLTKSRTHEEHWKAEHTALLAEAVELRAQVARLAHQNTLCAEQRRQLVLRQRRLERHWVCRWFTSRTRLTV